MKGLKVLNLTNVLNSRPNNSQKFFKIIFQMDSTQLSLPCEKYDRLIMGPAE